MASNMRVGFIGAGKMATALARGFVRGKLLNSPAHVMASCPIQDKHLLSDMESMGCKSTHNNRDIVEQCDVTILAVKPNVIPFVLKDIAEAVTNPKLIVSIAAGLKISDLEALLPEGAKVVRVMPNTPSLVGEGATVYATGQHCNGSEAEVVKHLFATVGEECHQVDEKMIDAVTGISGSGPAYMYLIIEAMADAGVKNGLPRDLAYRLAAQTMVGAGQMVLKTGKHPAVLKDDVCSPSGSTITALDALERNGLRTCVMQAVEAATERCHELGSN